MIQGKSAALVAKKGKKGYNTVFMEGLTKKMDSKKKDEGSSQMSKEHAGELLDGNLKFIRETIKNRSLIYPVNPKEAFKKIVEVLRDNDYKIIRDIRRKGVFELCLNCLMKNVLIERAYFVLEREDFIQKTVIKLSKAYEISQSQRVEITIFVKERLESEEFKRIKKFEEESKFTTFLFTVVRRLMLDFLRKYNKMRDSLTIYPRDIIDKLHESKNDPQEVNILLEEEAMIEKIAKLVTGKAEALDYNERVAFKMYYMEGNMNYNAIGRTLGTSRYKAKQVTQKARDKIVCEVKKTKKWE